MARAYRVRGVPLGWDTHRVRVFLTDSGGAESTTTVSSLALEVHGRSQTATVSFQSSPAPLQSLPAGRSWSIPLQVSDSPARPQVITIDADFFGITTLYTAPPQDHKVDVIAIAGLGGHAFGSFKDRGGEWMWLRDSLPHDLTSEDNTRGIGRVMIYGYESALAGSRSFQNLEDLAASFHNSLLAVAKPIIFIAHSLGGLILKQMLISLSSSNREEDRKLLGSVYGIAFFGVPQDGMEIGSLISMVADGPNRYLVESIGRINSQILTIQRRDFRKAMGERGETEIVCFYETRMSPTISQDESGMWKMKGPDAVLVSKSSATHGRDWEDGPEHICPIDRTHSEMVKFGPQDHEYEKVLKRLRGLARRAGAAPPRRGQSQRGVNSGRQPEIINDSVDHFALFVQVMEEKHLNTLSSMNNLASAFWAQGRWEEAERLLIQVVESRKAKFGAEHPDTLSSMNDLASAFWAQGRWEEAKRLLIQVVESRKAMLGAEHPDTLSSMNNLASAFWAQGRWEEAEKLLI